TPQHHAPATAPRSLSRRPPGRRTSLYGEIHPDEKTATRAGLGATGEPPITRVNNPPSQYT
ncbi:hypothetical protein, partial [Streptomyces niveus]|uniref:hypothetical protein n=1 Tax=Streptomyces niveus TaxID=193462 RepID=UPI0036652077